jgi:hypothetical protein
MAVTLMSGRSEDEILRYWPLLDQIAENEKQVEQRITGTLDAGPILLRRINFHKGL